ncbi:MAG: hypothetical protein ABIN67_03430 [Ferruginibacter sp.]
MRQIINFFLFFYCINPVTMLAQDCVLQPPSIKIDFGNAGKAPEVNLSGISGYERIDGPCPQDGHYTFTTFTEDCFNGHWITMDQDHTNGDVDGKMLLVNASYPAGIFFMVNIDGLKPNTIYELGSWIVNVCKPYYDCAGIRPNLRFIIENGVGQLLARFGTGDIEPTGEVTWLQYSARFTTPTAGGRIVLKIEDKAEGGCGNDFALDDITLQECLLPKPVEKPLTKLKAAPKPVAQKPVPKTPAILKAVKKDEPVLAKLPPGNDPQKMIISKPAPTFAPAPVLILTRENPIVKKIETGVGELQVDLYDNGIIDGDTVTIYHNNELVISRAGLSATPISIRIPVDAKHPHHELVMVANNLGSIPPNTSLMIITDKNKRYEVFISSSEQKNAKVVIDLKE